MIDQTPEVFATPDVAFSLTTTLPLPPFPPADRDWETNNNWN